jgi:catechol 2,3-dioxygenase-like lactoylglutathione lyase family enzyme
MPKIIGLRHLALNVSDIQKSKAFYIEVMGMRVAWEPDSQSTYLTSGTDNLALHELPPEKKPKEVQSLDHLGFLVESIEEVLAWANHLEKKGVSIAVSPRAHRDGSFSYYLREPDGNLIQILYEPQILRFTNRKKTLLGGYQRLL